MKKPKMFDSYKEDQTAHRHEMTVEAHRSCKEYEKFLLDKKSKLDYEFAEYNIKIEKVNGFIVQVKTDMPISDFIDAVDILRNLL